MDQHKRALIRAITSARLAKSAGISTTHLSRIMSGNTSASESSAHELSSVANQMCESLELPAPFEPADFRPQLSLDYDSRELGPHEMFTVFDSRRLEHRHSPPLSSSRSRIMTLSLLSYSPPIIKRPTIHTHSSGRRSPLR